MSLSDDGGCSDADEDEEEDEDDEDDEDDAPDSSRERFMPWFMDMSAA